MKFSNLVITSSILLWQQNAVVVSSSSGKLRASGGVNRELAVQTDAAACLTMEDLGFPEFASITNCENRGIVGQVKKVMKAKNCSDKVNKQAIRAEIKALTEKANYKKGMLFLKDKCDDYVDYGGSCTSYEKLNFRTIEKCSNSDIQNRISEKMEEADCAHNINKEMELLTGKIDTDAAKEDLQAECTTIFGCTQNFNTDGCDYREVVKTLEKKLRNCPHSADEELQKMTGTDNIDDAKEYLSEVCDNVFESVDESTYTDIDSRFNDGFMADYTMGKGFLNTETGNFQGGQNKNPASPESLSAGVSINNFYDNGASTSILNVEAGAWDIGSFDTCQFQSYMCCFGRDRQSNDDNGNCGNNDCDDADPGDNSNLCFTEPSNTPYFGQIEDDIHCHGLAWADDSNDLISRFKVNNFFFVSMYDHMYTRGYVEPAVTGGPDELAMCGCIEDMPKVSRADCTQVDVDMEFSFSRDSNGFMQATAQDDVDVEFNACKGNDFDDGNNANNDLASYTVRLVEEGRMSASTQDEIFKTLLGYADPGENENEAVCVAAYEELVGATHPCTNIGQSEFNGCDFQSLKDAVEDSIREDCPHGIEVEFMLLTGTSTYSGAKEAIDNMCASAWDTVAKSSFQGSISNDFTNNFMRDYIKGETFLNTETGNFQGDTSDSDEESLAAGEAINAYYEADAEGASNSILVANFPSVQTNFDECAHQSIMCCFGRDRQFGDNNGDCSRNDCDDADPGDNSNLCYTEPSNTPFPKDAEGDVHCHGLAWGNDGNDFGAQLKYNNFFYVSLYDHMYSRGYVQEMTFDQPDVTDDVPMCGCIEDMQPVSRADCTELAVEQTFQFSIGENGALQAEPKGDMEIEFNACKGTNPGNPSRPANNDLASYVYLLVEEGKMAEDTKTAIYNKLVGYAKPGSNANEGSCKASYEEKTGLDYPRN